MYTVDRMGRRRAITPIADRLWAKVQKTESCWLWTGSRTASGHGKISAGNHRPAWVHRLSWEIANGPIPDGMCVCHRCDNPACVRPDHLFLGTQADNIRDMRVKGRQARAVDYRTHCKHGHPFDEANTIWRSGGGRKCRACMRAEGRARQERKRSGHAPPAAA